MKVSVIIPTFNEERVIGNCLNSLGKQSFKDLEIIVVDDGSKDKTLQVLSELRVMSDELRIIEPPLPADAEDGDKRAAK